MRASLTPRKHTTGGVLSFITQTNWARPSFTPSRTVNFSTSSGLSSAISGMQPGDLIQYNGTGVLTISSSTSNAFKISNKNPSSPVVIDFGCSNNIWDSSKITPNYVEFSYTGGGGFAGLYVDACSNLRIYGGYMTTNATGADGIRFQGNCSNIYCWDQYVYNVGACGANIQPINSSTGAAALIDSCNWRIEVNRFSMNPAQDPHADKGSGLHGMILHGSSGSMNNCTYTCYAHDSLKPGETSAGKTWPEGGGGSCIEPGTGSSTDARNNNTYYAKGENLLMIPNGTNPGSTASQFGGCVMACYGGSPFNGNVIGWAEGINNTGAVVFGSSGNWHNASPQVVVNHGRHTNTNQSTAGQNISEPYDSRWGVHYNDCT